jgi:hypothetical protein
MWMLNISTLKWVFAMNLRKYLIESLSEESWTFRDDIVEAQSLARGRSLSHLVGEPCFSFSSSNPSGPFYPNNRCIMTKNLRLLTSLSRHELVRALSQPYRCFSCSIRAQQSDSADQPPPKQNERLTHFGFETVTESAKRSKGTRLASEFPASLPSS